jgi:protein TonB
MDSKETEMQKSNQTSIASLSHYENELSSSNEGSSGEYGLDHRGVGHGIGTEGEDSGPGREEGKGTGGPGHGETNSLNPLYLQQHFAYIRELILKNLKYPPVARTMGWKGVVTVSFVVLENGTAENIRVVKSSGNGVLDRNVVRTIQEIQPFPKPPGKAELIIPITFRLE